MAKMIISITISDLRLVTDFSGKRRFLLHFQNTAFTSPHLSKSVLAKEAICSKVQRPKRPKNSFGDSKLLSEWYQVFS